MHAPMILVSPEIALLRQLFAMMVTIALWILAAQAKVVCSPQEYAMPMILAFITMELLQPPTCHAQHFLVTCCLVRIARALFSITFAMPML